MFDIYPIYHWSYKGKEGNFMYYGCMIDERARPDFTNEQESFCRGLGVLSPQIEDLGMKIRNDRKRSSMVVMPPNSPIEYAFCQLEDTVNSYQEICGGYWQGIDIYPSFESFIEFASGYLEDVQNPCLDKIKKIEMPGKGMSEASMVESFKFYLERAENIHKVIFSMLLSFTKEQSGPVEAAAFDDRSDSSKTGVFDGIVFVKGACYGKVLSPEQEFRLKKIFELNENKPAFYSDVFNEDMKDNTVYQFINRANDKLFRGKNILHKDGHRVYWSA